MLTTTIACDPTRTVACYRSPVVINGHEGRITVLLDHGNSDGALQQIGLADFHLQVDTSYSGECNVTVQLCPRWTRNLTDGYPVFVHVFGLTLELKPITPPENE